MREHCTEGAAGVQRALMDECGVSRSIRAIEVHASRIHMSLRVRQTCPECGVVGVRLNRQSGLCPACTEFEHVEEERAFNALLELEAAEVKDKSAIEAAKREYVALRQRNSRLCKKHGLTPKSKRDF